MGRIAQVMMSMENRSVRRGILLIHKKGFAPGDNGYGEHLGATNMAIN
jgi:hypothetical protein